MDTDYGFCTHCGAELPEGAQYCPECGTSFVKGSDIPNINYRGYSPLKFILILLGIYAFVSIGEGIYSAFFNDMLMDTLRNLNGGDLSSYLSSLGLQTEEQLAEILYKEGILTLIDGIIVLMVFILCYTYRHWKMAVALCVIASFLLLIAFAFMPVEMMKSEAVNTILQVIVGLLISRGIYINRSLFK